MGESHGYFHSFLLQDVRGGEQDKAVLRADRGGLSAAGGRGHDVAGEHEEPARADAELPLLQRLLLELPLQDVHRDRPLHLALSHLLVSSRNRALKKEITIVKHFCTTFCTAPAHFSSYDIITSRGNEIACCNF